MAEISTETHLSLETTVINFFFTRKKKYNLKSTVSAKWMNRVVCTLFWHQQQILQLSRHQLGFLQFNSILMLHTWSLRQIPQVKRAQSHGTPQLKMPVISPRCSSLSFWLASYKFKEGFPNPLLRFDNLREQFTKLRKALYLILLFIINKIIPYITVK